NDGARDLAHRTRIHGARAYGRRLVRAARRLPSLSRGPHPLASAVVAALSDAPRSAADMTNITALVRSAIGFNEQRGDQVQVTNMQFAAIDVASDGTPAAEPLLGFGSEMWFKLGQILILSVTALLVFLLVVKPMIRRLTTPMAQAAGAAAGALQGGQSAAQAAIAAGDGSTQAGMPAQLNAPAGSPPL